MIFDDLDIIAAEIAGTNGKDFDYAFKEMVKSMAIGYRATLLKQEFDKLGKFPSSSEATFTVSTTEVPATECLSEDVKCTVTRSKYKIPKPIRTNISSVPFRFVGTANQAVSFIFVKPEEVDLIICGTRFIKNDVLYSYINGYIYTYNHDGGKITIRDPFADPRELSNISDCDGNTCDQFISIDQDMKKTIKMMIIEELRLFPKPEDKQIKINEE